MIFVEVIPENDHNYNCYYFFVSYYSLCDLMIEYGVIGSIDEYICIYQNNIRYYSHIL